MPFERAEQPTHVAQTPIVCLEKSLSNRTFFTPCPLSPRQGWLPWDAAPIRSSLPGSQIWVYTMCTHQLTHLYSEGGHTSEWGQHTAEKYSLNLHGLPTQQGSSPEGDWAWRTNGKWWNCSRSILGGEEKGGNGRIQSPWKNSIPLPALNINWR